MISKLKCVSDLEGCGLETHCSLSGFVWAAVCL